MKFSHSIKKININGMKTLNAILIVVITGLIVHFASATTPNPGHPWTEVGDGTFAISGPTALRTYTVPDVDATLLTTNTAVTAAQGGTGQSSYTAGDLLYASGATALSKLATGSATQVLHGGATPSWSALSLTDDVTGILSVVNGGTGTDALTANNVLLGNGTGAPLFVAPGTSGNLLQSNGSTWTSVAQPSLATIVTRSYTATGAATARATNSLTDRNTGLFTVPESITVNKLSFNVVAVTTAGTMKACIYSEDGSTKVVDVTSGTVTVGTNTVTVSPAVTLTPGNYYITTGCATTCNNTVSTFTSTSIAMITGTPPSGERAYEGTVTHTSGTCNSTLGTITGSVTRTPIVRLDN